MQMREKMNSSFLYKMPKRSTIVAPKNLKWVTTSFVRRHTAAKTVSFLPKFWTESEKRWCNQGLFEKFVCLWGHTDHHFTIEPRIALHFFVLSQEIQLQPTSSANKQSNVFPSTFVRFNYQRIKSQSESISLGCFNISIGHHATAPSWTWRRW